MSWERCVAYAGVSARLIQATLKDDGSECIFFFNFNRVNAAIDNGCVEEHVKRLTDNSDPLYQSRRRKP